MRVAVVALFALTTAGAAIAGEHRHLGPHQHGRGTFTIAVDGTRLQLELDAPGHDIIGFEHAATSDADKRKLAEAGKVMSDPLKLFVVPESAGCKVVSAKAGLEDEHEHDEAAAKEAGHDEHGEEHEGHHHSDFSASYELECAKPENIDGMTFKYFDAFPGAQELDVKIATPKGQTQQLVTRAKPQLSLDGLM